MFRLHIMIATCAGPLAARAAASRGAQENWRQFKATTQVVSRDKLVSPERPSGWRHKLPEHCSAPALEKRLHRNHTRRQTRPLGQRRVGFGSMFVALPFQFCIGPLKFAIMVPPG
jgi:hypothetical protein